MTPREYVIALTTEYQQSMSFHDPWKNLDGSILDDASVQVEFEDVVVTARAETTDEAFERMASFLRFYDTASKSILRESERLAQIDSSTDTAMVRHQVISELQVIAEQQAWRRDQSTLRGAAERLQARHANKEEPNGSNVG